MSAVWTDLHGHTFYSDGVATPGEFARFRQAQGFKVIAVSDHDHFAAVRAVAAAASPLGLVVVPAAELTAWLHPGTDRAEQVHVLCYFPPSFLEGDRLERTAMYQRGLAVQAAWRAFILAWMQTLPPTEQRLVGGPALTLERPGTFPGLQTLIDRISARSPELYDRFRLHHVRFWQEHPDLFGWTPEALIDAIRADGGVDVVAHAARYRDEGRRDEILAYAQGVEVYTSRHKDHVAARFRAFAEQAGKLWTASSDDHQRGKYLKPPVGTPVATLQVLLGHPVPAEWVAEDAGG